MVNQFGETTKMKIIYETIYRDGGTWSVKSDDGVEYCKDYRMTSDKNNPGYATYLPTVGKWFVGYPKNDRSNLILDEQLIIDIELALTVFRGK